WGGSEFGESSMLRLAALAPTLLGPVAMIALFVLGWRTRRAWWPALERRLEAHSRALDAIPAERLGPWILLASGAGLFAELMMIRVHASCFQLFALFKNVSLLSCFLGLGIGYARSDRGPATTPLVLPAIALQIALLRALRLFGIGSFLRNPSAGRAARGFARVGDVAQALTVYGFLIAVFSINALCFVPLGQTASRLMSRCERLPAYGWNLIGSLA